MAPWQLIGMKKFFIKTKPCSVLLLLKDSQQQWYPSKLARASGASYVHTSNLLLGLRKKGIVSVEKKAKQNIYKLTDKGAQVAFALEEFIKKCDAAEQEQKSQADAEKQVAAAQASSSTAAKEKLGESDKKPP